MANLFPNWNEAMELVRDEKNKPTRRLLMRFIAAVGRHSMTQDIVSAHTVDMVYWVQILREVFSEHDAIRAILDGKYAGEWFVDEDDGIELPPKT